MKMEVVIVKCKFSIGLSICHLFGHMTLLNQPPLQKTASNGFYSDYTSFYYQKIGFYSEKTGFYSEQGIDVKNWFLF